MSEIQESEDRGYSMQDFKNSMLQICLEALSKTFLNAKTWDQMQEIVKVVDQEDLTGSQKMTLAREKAWSFIEETGANLMSFLVGLALEMAVTKVNLAKLTEK